MIPYFFLELERAQNLRARVGLGLGDYRVGLGFPIFESKPVGLLKIVIIVPKNAVFIVILHLCSSTKPAGFEGN